MRGREVAISSGSYSEGRGFESHPRHINIQGYIMKAQDRIKMGLLESDDIVDEYFTCECSNPEHAMLITFDPDICCPNDDVSERFPELVVSVQMSPYMGFFKRLKTAFKYVFNIKDDTVHWDCCAIREEDVNRFQKMIDMYRYSLFQIERANKSKYEKCEACGAKGSLTPEYDHNTVEIDGKEYLVNMIYHVCKKCGSELTLADDESYNKNAMIEAKWLQK
jgi:hypothetical protein